MVTGNLMEEDGNSKDKAEKANDVAKVDTPIESHGSPMVRLPRSIWLDERVKVNIKLVSPQALLERGGKGLAGLWDPDSHNIYIDKTITTKRRWITLRHELVHACIDTDVEATGGI
jgi:hypothetical protein